ncbi:MAG: hypothetical protein FJ217_11730 [Ignavibacteria bacterium]|nr:hypothetical protein [Ignavibacteria bacterium]
MRRDAFVAALVLLLAGAVLSGCSKSVTGPESSVDEQDLAAIRTMILEDPLFTSDSYTLDDGDVVTFGTSLRKTMNPVIPISWGRRVTNRNVDTQFENVNDTTVMAIVTHTIKGDLIILAKSSTNDTVRITKPFTNATVRKVKFYRHGRISDPGRGWKHAEISGVKGGTEGSQVTITSLQVTIGNETHVIADPTEYFFKVNRPGPRPLPVLAAFQPIKLRVTLTSADPDTDWVSLHRPFMIMILGPEHRVKALHIRMKLVSETRIGGLYERAFEYSWAGHIPGRHTVLVDAVTRSSLFDDTAPFSTQIWGIPYIVQ